MKRILDWKLAGILGAGALVEIIVLLASLPENSQPPTPIQTVLGYTQIPAGVVFSLLFGTGLGHWLDTMPAPAGAIIFWIGAVAVFLFQSALFGFVLWLPVRATHLRFPPLLELPRRRDNIP